MSVTSSPTRREALAALAGVGVSELPLPSPDDEAVDQDLAPLIALVEALHPTPAYLLGPRVLAQ